MNLLATIDSDTALQTSVTLLSLTLWILLNATLLWLVHFLLTLPMRRAERGRLFLDLLQNSLDRGQPLEEMIISMARSRDLSMGVRFHLLAAWLEHNFRLHEALAKVPVFLSPQVDAVLQVGQKIGDLRKVLPACRQLTRDAVSKTRAAMSYLIILTLVITPVGIFLAGTIKVIILPRFGEVIVGVSPHETYPPAGFGFDHLGTMLALHVALLLILWVACFGYIAGPRIGRWFPIAQRLHYALPWRRKRMQRDFSAMLAILLDSGMPETEAVCLAADCTANSVFRERAAVVARALQQGKALPEAIRAMDDSGELGWRLTNALHRGGGFLKALAGWHESLDAKAFQEEQAAAHGVTSALVLWTGVFVGIIVVSTFGLLMSVYNLAVLW